KPVLLDRENPFIKAAAGSCEKAFGTSPVFIRSGGTIPAVAAFQQILNVPVALIGFGLPGDQIHAPNERFHLPNLFKGIATSILFMNTVGVVGRKDRSEGTQARSRASHFSAL